MNVEMSLEEILINAITSGRIPGVQFKRSWSDERKTFDGLRQVISEKLDEMVRDQPVLLLVNLSTNVGILLSAKTSAESDAAFDHLEQSYQAYLKSWLGQKGKR